MFGRLELEYVQHSVVLAISQRPGVNVLDDGYVGGVCAALEAAVGAPAVSFFSVNSTANPLHRRVPLASPLYVSADGSATIMLFDNDAGVTSLIGSALGDSAVHPRTDDYWIGVTSLDSLDHTDADESESLMSKVWPCVCQCVASCVPFPHRACG